MEFNEKLQELRRQKGITQEELAASLWVSRTAVSKWESGRGYPNIESLKAIAKFFSVSLDELLSSDEALFIAERDNEQKQKHLRDLVYGLLDLSIALLLFLPFFAQRSGADVQSVSLIALGVRSYLKIAYFTAIGLTAAMGVATLALQNCKAQAWQRSKAIISLALGAACVLLFTVSSQPYAAVFAFVLLAIKALMLIKRK